MSGPCQVLAGPGSGKTYVIVQRILYLITVCQVPPSSILVLTFSKAAAAEMQQRFLLKSHHQYPEVSFGTFHSVFYQILKREAVPPPQLISVAFQMGLLQRLWEDVQGNTPAKDEIRALAAAISRAKSDPGVNVSIPFLTGGQFHTICERYDRQLRERGLLDFDDMILECQKLLRSKKELLRRWQQRFPWILVDEFQDINTAQYEILELLAGQRANLFTVGDDDQSIYGFRGAAPGIMRRFLTDHPRAQRVELRCNYRCSQQIITLSQKLIVQNKDRLPKQVIATREAGPAVKKTGFLSAREEYDSMIRELQKMTAGQRSKTAIIVRTHMQGQRIYDALKKAGISCAQEKQFQKQKLGNLFFYETVAGYFKLAAALGTGIIKRKELYLVMNRPERYLPRSIAKAETVTRDDLQKAVRENCATQKALSELLACCDTLRRMKPVHGIKYLRKTAGIERWLQTKDITAKECALLFDTLQREAVTMHSQRELLDLLCDKIRQQYDQSVGRSAPGMTAEKENTIKEGSVHLLTMHASKGLEFDSVFLPDLNEGILPSRQADTPALIEEERRLFYVAITRARDRLWLFYVTGTAQSPVPVSRFLVSLS